MSDDVIAGGAGGGSPRRRPSATSSLIGAKRGSRGDATFRRLTKTAGIGILVLLAAVAVFLIVKAVPAIQKDTVSFFTTSEWSPDASPSVFGIAALAAGTLVSSALALLIGVPVAVGVALFISHYAPRRLAQGLGYIVDLLAAVPSVVYGLWALVYLVPNMIPLSKWLHTYLGFIPLFASEGIYGKSLLVGGVVLAVMILPIVAAISREVFLLTPREHIEGAYALGATRWEMVRTVVLPYGKPGVISATVLGFGRALGETIAVALILPANYIATLHILEPKGNSIAANIANVYGDAGEIGRGALIASGLVLFAMTLVVNIGARLVIARRRDFRAAT